MKDDRCRLSAAKLSCSHIDELAPPRYQSLELSLRVCRQRTLNWLYRLSELSQHIRIDAVCLGEAPHGLRELANLAGVGDNHGELGSCQSRDRRDLISAGCFEYDPLRLHSFQTFDQLRDSFLVIADDESLTRWSR